MKQTLFSALTASLFLGFILAGNFQDVLIENEERYYGTWEVVAESCGGQVRFSEYSFFELSKERVVLTDRGSKGVCGYKKAELKDLSEELRLLAWHESGSADGTPVGVPTLTFIMKVVNNRAILHVVFGPAPTDELTPSQQDGVCGIVLVLTRKESKE